jgi:hypothetical protein
MDVTKFPRHKPLAAGFLAGALLLGYCRQAQAVLIPDCTEHAEATVVEPPFACATLEPGQAFPGCALRFYLKNGAECASPLEAIDFTFLGCSEPYGDGPCASLAPGKTGMIVLQGLNVGTHHEDLFIQDGAGIHEVKLTVVVTDKEEAKGCAVRAPGRGGLTAPAGVLALLASAFVWRRRVRK